MITVKLCRIGNKSFDIRVDDFRGILFVDLILSRNDWN